MKKIKVIICGDCCEAQKTKKLRNAEGEPIINGEGRKIKTLCH